MSNHFHLVIETPQPNLSEGMKWLLQTYTRRFNRRHGFFGHVFSGRFKAPLVDGSGTGYSTKCRCLLRQMIFQTLPYPSRRKWLAKKVLGLI